MAKLSNYTMNFSDGILSFKVEPYAANGPESPSEETLFETATSADTSLVIIGKYFENYGERIQENLIHLLENFAMDEEPVYPVGGQIWYDRSQTPPIPKIYNPKKSVNSVSGLDEIKIKGNHIVRLNNLITKQRKIRIFSNTKPEFQSEDYIISSPRYDNINDETIIQIPNKLLGQRRNWYVGGWDDIIISSNGIIDLKNTELQNIIVGDIITDSQDKDYNPKSVINISQLEKYVKSLNLPTQSGTLGDIALSAFVNDKDIIAFEKGLDKWINLSLSEVIKNSGDILLGGDLDLNNKRIFGIKNPDGKTGDEVVTVDYLKSILKLDSSIKIDEPSFVEHLADIKDVRETRDPSSPEDPEINKYGNLLYYDGNLWNGLSRSEFSRVGILGSDGTLIYDNTNNLINESNSFLEPDALISYNTNSSYFNNISDFVKLVDDDVLISKRMGNELWGGDSKGKIVYGNYDGNRIYLGYSENTKPDEKDSYIPENNYVPAKPNGVIFDLNVLDSTHTALDPKDFYGIDDLFFESSLAKIVDDYPNIKLNDIIDVINRDLGDISSYPFRQLITIQTAISKDKDKNEIMQFMDYYTVGKSTLSIYANGLKLYASLPNTLTCNFITPAGSPPDPNDPNAIVNALDENGNLDFKKSYEIDEVDNGTSPYVSIIGDEENRFSELKSLKQKITFSTNPNPFDIEDVFFNPEKMKTYIYFTSDSDLSGIDKGDNIFVENVVNTNGKIWGGYPTGLKLRPNSLSNEKHLYQFDISLDKETTWKTVVIEGQKNVAQVVHAINEWSMNNGGEFSVFLERGNFGFISGKPGKHSSIRIKESSSSKEAAILKIYNCDGKTSPCGSTLNKTDDEIFALKGKGFVIDGKDSEFPVGSEFIVKDSEGNNGVYTVKEVNKNICGNDPPKDEVTIRVNEIDQITNDNPDDFGTISLKIENLFKKMVGGVSNLGHYYYKFDSETKKWKEKFPEVDEQKEGDYSEIGMPEYPSNEIKVNKDFPIGTRFEIVINQKLNANY